MERHPLHSKYPDLHKSKPVELEVKRRRRAGEALPNEPKAKLNAWLETLEGIHTGKGRSEKHQQAQEQVTKRIKDKFHRPVSEGGYITGTDERSVESYLRHQAQIAHQQGHGEVEDIMARVNDQVRNEARLSITQDQERSLDRWYDYLTSPDATYPMWFKYYVWRNITKLASYDKEKGEFPKRSKSTTVPFPDINREALAYMEDSLSKHYGLQHLDPNNPDEIDPATKELLDKDANFAQLYKRAIEYTAPKHAENLNITDGVWVKFEQTDDPEKAKQLAHSLHGYNTGWCTAGEGTASAQLRGGDFYVYYTRAEDGQYSVPRVAIRMQEQYGKQTIAEVRGIEADQHLEAALVDVAQAKMHEVDPAGAKSYNKKVSDMHRLTEIDKLLKDNPQAELTRAQLRFLYEIDTPIEGFGYNRDPRIDKILSTRYKRADLAYIFAVRPDQISLTKKEALREGIVYHYGSLYLGSLTSAEGLKLPETVGGGLYLRSLTSAEKVELQKQYPNIGII